MKIVILPGLDGSGFGLERFVQSLLPEFIGETVTFPPDNPLGYDELEILVRPRLPSQDFLLLGESFSGPLALRIARSPPLHLKAVILCASFARLDLPFRRFLAVASQIVTPRLVPLPALSSLLLGADWTTSMSTELSQAIARVHPFVLQRRALAALTEDATGDNRRVALPTLCLCGTGDRLMPRSAAASVAEVCSNLRTVDMAGPHFLLQTRPEACAAQIKQFAEQLG